VKEDDRRKRDEVAQRKAMQRQTIEAFVESKRLWEERDKERQRMEEARIEDFLAKKEAWRQAQIAHEVDKRQRKSQVSMLFNVFLSFSSLSFSCK
jgi:hypothetical protein